MLPAALALLQVPRVSPRRRHDDVQSPPEHPRRDRPRPPVDRPQQALLPLLLPRHGTGAGQQLRLAQPQRLPGPVAEPVLQPLLREVQAVLRHLVPGQLDVARRC